MPLDSGRSPGGEFSTAGFREWEEDKKEWEKKVKKVVNGSYGSNEIQHHHHHQLLQLQKLRVKNLFQKKPRKKPHGHPTPHTPPPPPPPGLHRPQPHLLRPLRPRQTPSPPSRLAYPRTNPPPHRLVWGLAGWHAGNAAVSTQDEEGVVSEGLFWVCCCECGGGGGVFDGGAAAVELVGDGYRWCGWEWDACCCCCYDEGNGYAVVDATGNELGDGHECGEGIGAVTACQERGSTKESDSSTGHKTAMMHEYEYDTYTALHLSIDRGSAARLRLITQTCVDKNRENSFFVSVICNQFIVCE